MALSVDNYAMPNLFCGEDNASIFDDDDYESSTSEINNNNWQNVNLQKVNKDNNKNLNGFLLQFDDEYLSSLFEKEMYYFLGFDYLKRLRNGDLDLIARNFVVDWIQKVQSHYNFGPLCFYLSVNYLDRFLSTYELPKGKAWMMQLLAVACISLASKLDESNVPFSIDLQVGESKFIFEAKTIQRMELLVMSTLNWRLQSITPFSFIDYFLYKLSGDQMPSPSLISQAIQLISCTTKGLDFMEFKPSEIAAAVAIYVIQETQIVEHYDNSFCSLFTLQLQEERVMKCVEMMYNANDLTSTNVPQSPIGVLDASSCLSYTSDDISSIISSISCVNSTQNSPSISAPKRRKLAELY